MTPLLIISESAHQLNALNEQYGAEFPVKAEDVTRAKKIQ